MTIKIILLKVASIISLMFLDNENIDTALQEEVYKAQEPNFKRLKNRK